MLDTVHMKELSPAAARQKYRMHLDDKRRPKQNKQKAERREGLIEKITKEKKRVEEDMRLVCKSADCNAEKNMLQSGGLQRSAGKANKSAGFGKTTN